MKSKRSICFEIQGLKINPKIIHAAGKIEKNEIWSTLFQIPISKMKKKNSNLSLITYNQNCNSQYKNYKNLGLAEYCFDKLGVEYCVLSANTKIWSNRLKIPLTLDFLKKCNTEFVMACDSSDVFVFDLPDTEILNRLNCDMLFNAESYFWPENLYNIKQKEEKLFSGKFRYLNSGLWVARTNYAKNVFEILNKMYLNNERSLYKNSDQVLFKLIYLDQYPKIKIDHECSIFYNSSRIELSEYQKINGSKYFE